MLLLARLGSPSLVCTSMAWSPSWSSARPLWLCCLCCRLAAALVFASPVMKVLLRRGVWASSARRRLMNSNWWCPQWKEDYGNPRW